MTRPIALRNVSAEAARFADGAPRALLPASAEILTEVDVSKFSVLTCGVIAMLFAVFIGASPAQVLTISILALCYGQLGEILDLLDRKL
jgi:hypothetical protein